MNDKKGHLHPATQLIRELFSIVEKLGFQVTGGPELEEEFYNFDALNIGKDHPSRDMQDTFWIKGEPGRLLTTQTSAIQIRFMEKNKPPFKIIAAGKVYRNEATDTTHEVQFHQIEGLVLNKKNSDDVSLADLKGLLSHILKNIFGSNIELRFRPSYFPFVEPAMEVDMKWNGRWLEIAGSGLVHPSVLKSVGINSDEYSGYAFAFGVDRLIMLKYGIDDIRHLYTGDLRFVNQF